MRSHNGDGNICLVSFIVRRMRKNLLKLTLISLAISQLSSVRGAVADDPAALPADSAAESIHAEIPIMDPGGTQLADRTQVALATPHHSRQALRNTLVGWSSVMSVELTAPINTNSARVGDAVEGKLAEDFCWGSQTIAAKDSPVHGRVTEVDDARTLSHAVLSSERRLKSRARLAVQFDQIVDQTGMVWPIKGIPSPRQSNVATINKSCVRAVKCDADGGIVKAEACLAGELKTLSNTAQVASMVPIPGTLLLTTLAPAVAMGAVGAASPSIAYNKPVDENTKHRRAKGAAYAFLTNLPGAFFVRSVIEKGNEIELIAGDRLTVNVCIEHPGTTTAGDDEKSVNARVINLHPVNRLYPAQ